MEVPGLSVIRTERGVRFRWWSGNSKPRRFAAGRGINSKAFDIWQATSQPFLLS